MDPQPTALAPSGLCIAFICSVPTYLVCLISQPGGRGAGTEQVSEPSGTKNPAPREPTGPVGGGDLRLGGSPRAAGGLEHRQRRNTAGTAAGRELHRRPNYST